MLQPCAHLPPRTACVRPLSRPLLQSSGHYGAPSARLSACQCQAHGTSQAPDSTDDSGVSCAEPKAHRASLTPAPSAVPKKRGRPRKSASAVPGPSPQEPSLQTPEPSANQAQPTPARRGRPRKFATPAVGTPAIADLAVAQHTQSSATVEPDQPTSVRVRRRRSAGPASVAGATEASSSQASISEPGVAQDAGTSSAQASAPSADVTADTVGQVGQGAWTSASIGVDGVAVKGSVSATGTANTGVVVSGGGVIGSVSALTDAPVKRRRGRPRSVPTPPLSPCPQADMISQPATDAAQPQPQPLQPHPLSPSPQVATDSPLATGPGPEAILPVRGTRQGVSEVHGVLAHTSISGGVLGGSPASQMQGVSVQTPDSGGVAAGRQTVTTSLMQGSTGTLHARDLARAIKQCRSLPMLLTLLQQHHANMDPVHMSACLHRAAQLWVAPRAARAADGDRAATGEPPGGAAALGRVRLVPLAAGSSQQGLVWSAAVQTAEHLVHMLQTNLQALQWRELSSILWALAKLGLRPAPVNAGFIPSVLAQMEVLGFSEADTQALSNTLWALATLRVRPDARWMQSMLVAVVRQVSRMDAQHLSVSLWAVARLRVRIPKTWAQRILTEVHRALPDKRELLTLLTTPQTHTPVPHPHTPRSRLLNMQQYANLLYALVRLRLIPKGADAWMARYWNATRVLLVLAAPRVGKGAKSAGAAPLRAALAARPLLPRHCVQLLWSVARLDGVYPPRVWVRALEGQLEQQVAHMSAQELAVVMHSYGLRAASHTPDMLRPWFPPPAPLLAAMCTWATRRKSGLSTQGVSNLLWGFAQLKVRYSQELQVWRGKSIPTDRTLTLPTTLTPPWLRELILAAYSEGQMVLRPYDSDSDTETINTTINSGQAELVRTRMGAQAGWGDGTGDGGEYEDRQEGSGGEDKDGPVGGGGMPRQSRSVHVLQLAPSASVPTRSMRRRMTRRAALDWSTHGMPADGRGPRRRHAWVTVNEDEVAMQAAARLLWAAETLACNPGRQVVTAVLTTVIGRAQHMSESEPPPDMTASVAWQGPQSVYKSEAWRQIQRSCRALGCGALLAELLGASYDSDD